MSEHLASSQEGSSETYRVISVLGGLAAKDQEQLTAMHNIRYSQPDSASGVWKGYFTVGKSKPSLQNPDLVAFTVDVANTSFEQDPEQDMIRCAMDGLLAVARERDMRINTMHLKTVRIGALPEPGSQAMAEFVDRTELGHDIMTDLRIAAAMDAHFEQSAAPLVAQAHAA